MQGTELLRRLRVALQDAEEPYRHSTDQIWRWIQAAYMEIQRHSMQWDFMHRRGLFISTTANVADYAVGSVREIADHSLYYIRPGTDAAQPMWQLSYQNWSMEQQSGLLRDGPPLYLVENPNKTWKVYPTPDRVYNIYADWWLRPAEMIDTSAEPIWASEYHELLVYEVMELVAGLEPDSPRSALMLAEANKFGPRLRAAFNSRYLPGITGPRPLL